MLSLLELDLREKASQLNIPQSLLSQTSLTSFLTPHQILALSTSQNSRNLCAAILKRYLLQRKTLQKFSKIELEFLSQTICKLLANSLQTQMSPEETHFSVNLLINIWFHNDPRIAGLDNLPNILPDIWVDRFVKGFLKWTDLKLTSQCEEQNWAQKFETEMGILSREFQNFEGPFELTQKERSFQFDLQSEDFRSQSCFQEVYKGLPSPVAEISETNEKNKQNLVPETIQPLRNHMCAGETTDPDSPEIDPEIDFKANFENFNLITNFHIVVVLNTNTTFHAISNYNHIIFKAT